MCLRGFFGKQRCVVDSRVNLYRSPDLVSKLMVVFVTGMILLGWIFILQAQGSQSGDQGNLFPSLNEIAFLPFGLNSDVSTNMYQDPYALIDPWTMFSPFLASPLSFGLLGPGMIFPHTGYTGLLGLPGPGMVFPYPGLSGYPGSNLFSGPDIFSPYGGFGYFPEVPYPQPALFSPYGVLGYFGFPQMFPPSSGLLGFHNPVIPPRCGYSPLATIAPLGYWEAGKVSSGASEQELPIFMPPGNYGDYTMADLMDYPAHLGIPIPDTDVHFNIYGDREYAYQLCQDIYTGAVHLVWDKQWWQSPSDEQKNGADEQKNGAKN